MNQETKIFRELKAKAVYLGLSQKEIARILGVHKSYVSHILSGRIRNPKMFEKISRIVEGHNGRRTGTHKF